MPRKGRGKKQPRSFSSCLRGAADGEFRRLGLSCFNSSLSLLSFFFLSCCCLCCCRRRSCSSVLRPCSREQSSGSLEHARVKAGSNARAERGEMPRGRRALESRRNAARQTPLPPPPRLKNADLDLHSLTLSSLSLSLTKKNSTGCPTTARRSRTRNSCPCSSSKASPPGDASAKPSPSRPR